MNKLHSLVLLSILFILTACSRYRFRPEAGDVVLMTYNTENLFDTVHDEGKNDYSELPFKLKNNDKHRAICSKEKVAHYRDECLYLDWNDEVLNRKFERLTDVVKQVNNGQGADVLFLQEIENINVLNLWMKHSLGKLGYKHVVLIEGPDSRGVDTALISKLNIEGKPILHHVKFQPINGLKTTDLSESRGILEATFKLPDGTLLTAFSLHLPSQAAPSEKRRQVVEMLAQRARDLPADRLIVASGDFNITRMEEIREEIVTKLMLPNFLMSHQIGCKHCEGSHNYRGDWSFLDMMFFSKNLELKEGKSGWAVIPESITTVTTSKFQIQSNSFTPSRFGQGQDITGVSDHFPVMAVLRKY